MDDGAQAPQSSLKGEYGNICLLLLLYTLQGVPMGLFGFVNMEVKELFKDSFSEQGTFMLAAWPFSLKLLWAPLVDGWYVESFGRRKSWMVPAQIVIGLLLLYLAPRIESLFEAKDVTTLTVIFFFLYLMCATQDIAVDGWALTMLRPENTGYASTCNGVGQTLGFSIGFMVPMARFFLLQNFMLACGTIFIGSTAAVWLLKTEAPTPENEQLEGLREAYTSMWHVMCCARVKRLALHLLTRSLAFIPADVMAAGRLQDRGFPKESIAGIKLCVTSLEIALPWMLSSITAGPRPLSLVIWLYLPRVALTLAGAGLIHAFGDIPQPTPMLVYAGVCAFTIVQGCLSNAMFVSHMAFFARVSDPAIGGTYMTFLNTIHNIGNMWTSTFCLKAADHIHVSTGYDGFYALSACCTAYGCVWLMFMQPVLNRMQEAPIGEWKVT